MPDLCVNMIWATAFAFNDGFHPEGLAGLLLLPVYWMSYLGVSPGASFNDGFYLKDQPTFLFCAFFWMPYLGLSPGAVLL